MARQVFDNRQVAHIWAAQSQERGRSNNGKFYFEGPTIFSYGSHWPLGHFFTGANGRSYVLTNLDRYGITTRKHYDLVGGAIYGLSRLTKLHVLRTRDMKDLVRALSPHNGPGEGGRLLYTHAWDIVVGIAKEWADDRLLAIRNDSVRKLAKARAVVALSDFGWAFNEWYEPLGATRDNLPAWVEEVALEIAPMLEECRVVVAAHDAKIEARRATKQAKQDAEQAKWREAQARRDALKIKHRDGMRQAWREGKEALSQYIMQHTVELGEPNQWQIEDIIGFNSLGYSALPTMVRKEGDEAVTSRGARVPWRAAVKLYQACAAHRASGSDHPLIPLNPLSTTVGHFTLTRIEPNGDCQVGCHILTFEELDLCAKLNGVSTEAAPEAAPLV